MNTKHPENRTTPVMPRLLQEIRSRPGLFIGRDSLPLLSAFIGGYLYAEGEVSAELAGVLERFQPWIAKKFRIKSSHDWSSIICFFNPSEAEAFSRFYELLDEFLSTERRHEYSLKTPPDSPANAVKA